MANSDRLIVGVDFGTTFTGVAMVYAGTPDQIDIIKVWPGANGISSDKVPTEFYYKSHGLSHQSASPRYGATASSAKRSRLSGWASFPDFNKNQEKDFYWGYTTKPGEPKIKCIKLFLDGNQQLPNFVSRLDVKSQLDSAERTVKEAAADFLTRIFTHTMSTLHKRYGETFVQSTQIEFVLTVPAIWSDAAKHATLQAAMKAGFEGNLRLISEPEAAAMYTLKAIQPNHLKVSDNVVVCDAGGGTVDLIPYRISKTEPLVVQECGLGTGGLCGSTFLNYRFEQHVLERMGQLKFDAMKKSSPRAWEDAIKYFDEYVKRNFNEEDQDDYNIPMNGIQDCRDSGIESGYMTLTCAQVKELFEPVIQEVIGLVEEQVKTIHTKGELVKAIILVGGFGQSAYLHKSLESHFSTAVPPPYSESAPSSSNLLQRTNEEIQVLQPINAWTAVVRGAVLRGLQGSIVSTRKARAHYGVHLAEPFKSAKHPRSNRYWDIFEEEYYAENVMRYIVAKDESLSENQIIPLNLCRVCTKDQFGDLDFGSTEILWKCVEDEAPTMYGPSIQKVCQLDFDLRTVPLADYEKCLTSAGTEYWELKYVVEVKVDSASLSFQMKVNGRTVGSVAAIFDD